MKKTSIILKITLMVSFLELATGVEPVTSSLPRTRSGLLSYASILFKKMERVKGIEPSQPAWKAGALPLSYTRSFLVERVGFEPTKAVPTDLQSAPFSHSGISPRLSLSKSTIIIIYKLLFIVNEIINKLFL